MARKKLNIREDAEQARKEIEQEQQEKKEKTVLRKKSSRKDALFTLDDATDPPEQDPSLTDKGRAKFTTMLKPELKEILDRIGKNKGMSKADVLEAILHDYFDMKGT